MATHCYPLILTLFLVHLCSGQQPSPCPDVFNYEPAQNQRGTWFGNITMPSPGLLDGVRLKIELDHPVRFLGNWFGETVTVDDQQWTIKNPDHRIMPGAPFSVRFFVKFSPSATVIPSVRAIILNDRNICNGGGGGGGGAKRGTQQQEYTPDSHTRRVYEDVFTSSSTSAPANDIFFNKPAAHHSKGGDDYYAGDLFISTPPPVLRPLRNKVKCGTVASRITPFIAYGQYTSPGDWPWYATIYHADGPNQMYTCGATLISENHVVTAAHCVTMQNSGRPIPVENLIIYLGKHNLKRQGRPVQGYDIEKISIHPEYNHSVYYNDVAVLKLEQAVEVNNYVRPCCLWQEDTELETVINRQGSVVGWGFDENRKLSLNLMQVHMPVVPTIKCIQSNPDVFAHLTLENSFCAGYRNGTNVCNGDSGSGMFFAKPNSDPPQWQIRGIVSLGVALQNQGVCDASQYAVFTDLGMHMNWIRKVIQ